MAARARERPHLCPSSASSATRHCPSPFRSFVRSFEVTFVRFISSGQGRDSEEGKEEGRKEGREARQTGHGRQKGEGRRGAQKILKGTTPDKGKTNLPSHGMGARA